MNGSRIIQNITKAIPGIKMDFLKLAGVLLVAVLFLAMLVMIDKTDTTVSGEATANQQKRVTSNVVGTVGGDFTQTFDDSVNKIKQK